MALDASAHAPPDFDRSRRALEIVVQDDETERGSRAGSNVGGGGRVLLDECPPGAPDGRAADVHQGRGLPQRVGAVGCHQAVGMEPAGLERWGAEVLGEGLEEDVSGAVAGALGAGRVAD